MPNYRPNLSEQPAITYNARKPDVNHDNDFLRAWSSHIAKGPCTFHMMPLHSCDSAKVDSSAKAAFSMLRLPPPLASFCTSLMMQCTSKFPVYCDLPTALSPTLDVSAKELQARKKNVERGMAHCDYFGASILWTGNKDKIPLSGIRIPSVLLVLVTTSYHRLL